MWLKDVDGLNLCLEGIPKLEDIERYSLSKSYVSKRILYIETVFKDRNLEII